MKKYLFDCVLIPPRKQDIPSLEFIFPISKLFKAPQSLHKCVCVGVSVCGCACMCVCLVRVIFHASLKNLKRLSVYGSLLKSTSCGGCGVHKTTVSATLQQRTGPHFNRALVKDMHYLCVRPSTCPYRTRCFNKVL